ncbi:PREDICTED: NHL repeat-containing protein 2 isoform X1 [Habropoda laboriosa]|uniref:NHL repeat-containing protein 2 isoform X1 n=1 Tax=Habropoda laboriosa TaxID=597456 RepID=UPI00083D4459|nr:PREDICTED: NHL repeat-containing protein 2 isoform X1 [Habropoda laboriosa]
MNIRDTVEELTQIGIEIRRSLESSLDRKEQEELILGHIKVFSNKESRIVDFQKGLEWFNVAEELSIYGHLSGKIIILDFFTYCCINCMHILPDLDYLEKRFSVTDGLVVVGVHSAKFSNERDSKRLLSAVQRYNIKHPVVNDASLSTWRDLGVCCWPTLVMIGPNGELLAVFVGEGHRDELILYADVALTYFKSLNKISKNDVPLQLSRHLLPIARNRTVLFPSKLEIAEYEQEEMLIIADTGNNRILVSDTLGNVKHVIGGFNPGFRDGDFENAKFNAPQGVCALDSSIYVADNENHAIRKIDMIKKLVITVAGTGTQGHDYIGGKIGEEQVLSSPWDVAVYNHEQDNDTVPVLLIAMAGTHQIWALFLQDTTWWKNRGYKASTCVAIVGSGKEENRNNTYPHAAGLAQPSGLTVVEGKKIALFADSESSAVRSIDLQTGRVSGVCGGNRNPADLHDFGDFDGVQYAAKLQHPLGITWDSKENVAYVADTYNHKIKKIDICTGYCKSMYGNGKPNDEFLLDEPSGITVSSKNHLLYVADTNNHAVKIINTKRENITTLSIQIPTIETDNSWNNVYSFDTTINESGGKLNISFDIIFLENDLKLNSNAPQKWTVNLSRNTGWSAAATSGELSSPVSIKICEGYGTQEVLVTLDIIACKITECVPKKLSVVYRVHQKTNAPNSVIEEKQLVVE